MAIISETLKQKEEEKDKKRKDNAKKFAAISVVGFAVSSAVYFFFDQNLGIFLSIVSSSIPSIVNLVDD